MFAEIKVVIEKTEAGGALIDEALTGDVSTMTDKQKKDRQTAEMAAYDKIGEDYEELLWKIEELVDEFDGTLVTVRMEE